MFRFACPKCGKKLKAGYEKVGKAAKCPTCMCSFNVPESTRQPQPVTPPEASAKELDPIPEKPGLVVVDYLETGEPDPPEDRDTFRPPPTGPQGQQPPQFIFVQLPAPPPPPAPVRYRRPALGDGRRRRSNNDVPAGIMACCVVGTTLGAVTTILPCIWLFGVPLSFASLVLSIFAAVRYRASGGIIACLVVSALFSLLGLVLAVYLSAVLSDIGRSR
jgi:hypothetical protein